MQPLEATSRTGLALEVQPRPSFKACRVEAMKRRPFAPRFPETQAAAGSQDAARSSAAEKETSWTSPQSQGSAISKSARPFEHSYCTYLSPAALDRMGRHRRHDTAGPSLSLTCLVRPPDGSGQSEKFQYAAGRILRPAEVAPFRASVPISCGRRA